MPIRFITRIMVLGLLVVAAVAFGGTMARLPEAAASPRGQTGVTDAEQTGANRAGLVIRFSATNVVKKCVTFSEPFIDGEDLLLRSGLNIGLGDDGAVCSIDNAGCPASDCFCQCPFPECEYWAYYNLSNGAWQYSSVGAGFADVYNGTVQGWSWGPGNWISGVEPPAVTFEEICPTASSSTSTPTSTVTATATATATATQVRSQGQAATATATSPAQTGALPLPQVSFDADSRSIAANTCTVLRWVTWDATQITLNGAPVSGQDRQEVCLSATQSYILVATNSTGESRREIIIQVTGAAASTAPPAQVPQPLPLLPTSTPAPFTDAQSGGPLPAVQPTIQSFGAVPTPQISAQGMASDGMAAPPAVQPVPTVYYTFAPTATMTPRPRRVLGADGRPTPTPMLMARADLPSLDPAPVTGQTTAAGSSQAAAPLLPTVDRSFRAALLPGYAGYLMIAASLVGACVWVIRRKGDDPGPER